jgi:putative ABC transport system permease protein
MNVISLSPVDLTIAAALVIVVAMLQWRMRLGNTKSLLIAATRTILQLLLLGMVLKIVFAASNLYWIALLSTIMLLAAGREVMVRQKRRFIGSWGFLLGTSSMFVSAFSITLLALLVIVQPEPWYLPQYSIPLLGMLLGNTLNGITLGLDSLTRNVWEQNSIIDGRLALGETWSNAISDIRRDSIRVGMIPIINAMSVAGLVSLPGMMTGQILAGTPPLEAVKYQILIMFLIAAGTGMGTITAIVIGCRRLFDDRERLRLDRLR